MFPYKDPGGTLKPPKALLNYRQLLHGQYRSHSKLPGSAFTLLEAFGEMPTGTAPQEDAVEWSAFPVTSGATNEQIDNERFRFQDEYLEWAVTRAAGKITEVTFTTEFAEYYEALAMIGLDALQAAIAAVMPGAKPTASELFGPDFDVATATPEGRAARFVNFAKSNPWNNGLKGILCLSQQFNTLAALFSLVGRAAVPTPTVSPGSICGVLGNFCGPARNSDPSIAAAVQSLAQSNRGVSLRDPAGVSILRLTGIWKRNGTRVDINSRTHNGGSWQVTRNGRRAVLQNSAGLTVDDEPITTGAQIASRLRVQAIVVSAAEEQLPEWARIGQESSATLDRAAAAGQL